MYCVSCQAAGPEAPVKLDGGAGADRFGSLQCQGCGALLAPHSPAAALVRKIMQLAGVGFADPVRGAHGD